MTTTTPKSDRKGISLHQLGVISGLTAGVWLGAAEAPTKLVTIGLSPFTVSLCMVVGVFTARWTFPTLLKGTTYVAADLRSKKHLIVWADEDEVHRLRQLAGRKNSWIGARHPELVVPKSRPGR